MKKKLNILTILLALPLSVMAQVSSIGLSAGYATDGVGILAQYNQFLGYESKSKLHGGLSYSVAWSKTGEFSIPYDDTILHLGYSHVVFSDKRDKEYFGSIGGGGLVGREVINNGNKEINSGSFINGEPGSTIYGAYISADFSYLITDNLALSIVINQSYIENSKVRNLLFYAGIGTKYYIF